MPTLRQCIVLKIHVGFYRYVYFPTVIQDNRYSALFVTQTDKAGLAWHYKIDFCK